MWIGNKHAGLDLLRVQGYVRQGAAREVRLCLYVGIRVAAQQVGARAGKGKGPPPHSTRTLLLVQQCRRRPVWGSPLCVGVPSLPTQLCKAGGGGRNTHAHKEVCAARETPREHTREMPARLAKVGDTGLGNWVWKKTDNRPTSCGATSLSTTRPSKVKKKQNWSGKCSHQTNHVGRLTSRGATSLNTTRPRSTPSLSRAALTRASPAVDRNKTKPHKTCHDRNCSTACCWFTSCMRATEVARCLRGLPGSASSSRASPSNQPRLMYRVVTHALQRAAC